MLPEVPWATNGNFIHMETPKSPKLEPNCPNVTYLFLAYIHGSNAKAAEVKEVHPCCSNGVLVKLYDCF